MLEIYDDERLVGRLSVFDNARKGVCYEFSYDESFLKSENAFAIDKNLALNAQIHKSTALWGCFKDCLPDRWGNLVLKRLFGSALSEFELLLCVSDFYRQGSLRFKINADCKGKFDKFLDEFKACFRGKRPTFMEKISPQNATLAELDALFESAMRVELDEYDESDLVLLQTCGAALGGARAKVCVVYQNELYLVKFALPNDDFSVILWEKTLLDLAHLAGIRVPESRLVALKNGQKALMIKRFDRINSARLPFLSARSWLNLQENSAQESSYTSFADSLCETSDKKELFCRMYFNALCANTDDHLKNHALLYDRAGKMWHLSPAYDLTPNPLPKNKQYHALNFVDFRSLPNLNELKALKNSFALDEKECEKICKACENALAKCDKIALQNGIKTKEIKHFSKIFKAQI